MNTPMEQMFSVLDETVTILQKELDYTYLEALAETGENLFQQEILQSELTEITKKRLKKIYSKIQLQTFNKEDIRKGYQMALLKGMKSNVQPNHQMTPDTIGFFITYLLNKFLGNNKQLTILDPAVGTGNLLATVINGLSPEISVNSYGVEIDDLLLHLAYTGANLQRNPTEFFNQDALEPLFIDPVDIVVCDLPVGYYPNDVRAAEYELKRDEGHSFSHHLYIEQSIKHTKPGGYLFFLIPNNLFQAEGAANLHEYLKREVYIQGVLQLPLSMFGHEKAAKSIFILQKKKGSIKAPNEVLLAMLPELKNESALDQLLRKIEKWFQDNK